mmetsp:Transcript_4801/g.6341  ORF Transcript_4801/g.6341 Transcript_4801/m.6341 type:complete len:120 (-) Transcript_4801:860-1219(-)
MRTKLVVTVFIMLVALLFYNMEPLLIYMGQAPVIADIARRVCCLLIPGSWAACMFGADMRFLTSQFHVAAPLIILLVMIPLHALLSWVFINHNGLGVLGMAAATDLIQILMMFSLGLFC